MTWIDLNSDLGENTPDRIVSDDAAMLEIVTSANVSCGFHAGSPLGIRETLAAAVAAGVTIGAHPGYDDYENFGRENQDIDPATLQAQVEYQLGAHEGLTRSVGGRVAYVKPHGALYNLSARDRGVAEAIAVAVRDFDPSLIVYGLAGSESIAAAAAIGLRVANEVFAERRDQADGRLVPRGQDGAVIEDLDGALAQVRMMLHDGAVAARTGERVPIRADTLCLHGDRADAPAFARALREALEADGIGVRAPDA